MKVIAFLIRPDAMGMNFKDGAIRLLGLVVGLSMAFGHGLGKLPPPEQLVQGLTSMGFPFPVFFSWCAALAEFLGGICLAVGLLTRGAAFFMSVTMAVAFFVVHSGDPFQSKELAFLYFGVAVLFLIYGGGKWSLDAVMTRYLPR